MFNSGNSKLSKEGWNALPNEENFNVEQLEQTIIEKQINDLEKEKILLDVMVKNVLLKNKNSTKILNPFDHNKDKMNYFKSVQRQAEGKPTIIRNYP